MSPEFYRHHRTHLVRKQQTTVRGGRQKTRELEAGGVRPDRPWLNVWGTCAAKKLSVSASQTFSALGK